MRVNNVKFWGVTNGAPTFMEEVRDGGGGERMRDSYLGFYCFFIYLSFYLFIFTLLSSKVPSGSRKILIAFA